MGFRVPPGMEIRMVPEQTHGRKHLHAEAFALMTYATEDGKELEAIWNSRDGVTPFYITSRSGQPMHHVDWHKDVYNPNHQPRPGDRVFVDLTADALRESVTRRVDEYWDHPDYPMSRTFESRGAAIDALAVDVQPGEPMLIEVGPDGWQP